MTSSIRRALMCLICLSCAPDYEAIEQEAIGDTFIYWHETVGRIDPFALDIDYHTVEVNHPFGGSAHYTFGRCADDGQHNRVVAIYAEPLRRMFGDMNYYGCFRTALTHEMAHAHLTCSTADHALGGILGPLTDPCSWELDPITLEALRSDG